ncbi:extracellular catalytic domain type 1 short-chain-length polyhydroxyalkanoate depolymerase [Hymenobacter koreensis]|uniref:Secretion system C-terminal sorting domain-containing protein n=1 Tax=Hymenobacter koreensis TaxID=1084523 RepID=A0ABP8IZX4_9BACT
MFSRLLFTSLLLSTLLLCQSAGLRAQSTVTGSIRHGGVVRDYRLYVPAIYNSTSRPVPLLFNLHGYTSNNVQQEVYGDFRAIADTANFLVVHPNGTVDASGNRHWNTFGPRGSGVDDVAFISALIDSLSARYRIDPNRVYSTGMSNGGFMSYELACQLSGRIAAVGSVTGSMIASRMNTCAPSRPVPIIEIHGTADATVPYSGGTALNFVPIPALLAHWVQVNGCNPTPVVTPVPNTNTTDGSTAERQVWSGGRNGSVVEHYRIIGGGHTWPGAVFSTGVTNRDINASREVWRFLRGFRLNSLPLAALTGPVNTTVALYPNPSGALLTIRAGGQSLRESSVAVFNSLGRRLSVPVRALPDGSLRLNTSGLPAGTYMVRVETARAAQQLKFIKP